MEWNIFARELRDILEVHGARLGLLNDRAGIHPQKVSRLRRGLVEPKFNVLTPDELDQVCHVFGLNADEQLRLRAAILATAVEEMLMNRIYSDEALAAANQILPIIYQLLQVNAGQATPLAQVKDGVMTFPTYEPLFESALDMLDRAQIALHLSDSAATDAIRIDYARQAHSTFEAAIAQMRALPQEEKDNETWRVWYGEAQKGVEAAYQRMQAA